ncbi:MAG: RNA 2'-phosphotransferase [Lachnospiraceae bacterium]|nr:RNA 2'-phosphotransferase [Lachnospiraceae bacterium]
MAKQQDIKVRIGKYVSMLLRHHPEEAEVSLDEHGWTDVTDLIEKVKPKYPLTEELLHEMALGIDKQRYEFSEDGRRVRAVHGHSVKVDLGYDVVEPPAILYHGTAEKYRDSIEEQGLIKKERQFVHLSEHIEQAKDVGRRHGKLVLYEVDSGKMNKDGHIFYRSTSGVWLTDHVPPQYLIEID